MGHVLEVVIGNVTVQRVADNRRWTHVATGGYALWVIAIQIDGLFATSLNKDLVTMLVHSG